MNRKRGRDRAEAQGPGWHGTGPCPEWAGKILARDRDVAVTNDRVSILHRPGELPGEYRARVSAAAPPLPDEVQELIRDGVTEYWNAR